MNYAFESTTHLKRFTLQHFFASGYFVAAFKITLLFCFDIVGIYRVFFSFLFKPKPAAINVLITMKAENHSANLPARHH